MAEFHLERANYRGWPNCYRLSNASAELIVTTDVGPRLIRFGFVGGDNEFAEFPAHLGQTGGDEWRMYGGHRLWHAPEAIPRTYFPDNGPVAFEICSEFMRVIQPMETTTGIQKEMDIRLWPDAACVQVTHRLRNCGLWAVELAAWALTAMAPGGIAVIPRPPRGAHLENLQPNSLLTLWPYTDLSDPRWRWGHKYVLLRQDPYQSQPQKIGAPVPDGWAAYARGDRLFVKSFAHAPGAAYPDFGCSAEAFANADMLELETLSPLTRLEPGAIVEHTEHWYLFRDVPAPDGDADVDRHILPKLKEIIL
ncbi:MAG: hypothetical protein HYZ49_12800 [Chloroflexi bacterium]|nr:hypothetical protein [Chloroflexota bacterium]